MIETVHSEHILPVNRVPAVWSDVKRIKCVMQRHQNDVLAWMSCWGQERGRKREKAYIAYNTKYMHMCTYVWKCVKGAFLLVLFLSERNHFYINSVSHLLWYCNWDKFFTLLPIMVLALLISIKIIQVGVTSVLRRLFLYNYVNWKMCADLRERKTPKYESSLVYVCIYWEFFQEQPECPFQLETRWAQKRWWHQNCSLSSLPAGSFWTLNDSKRACGSSCCTPKPWGRLYMLETRETDHNNGKKNNNNHISRAINFFNTVIPVQ